MRIANLNDDVFVIREFEKDGIGSVPLGSDVFATFDIETSIMEIDEEPHGIMYHWQFAIGRAGRRPVVIVGRTWRDFKAIMENLKALLALTAKKRLVIYVHNLAYEFQWLRSVLNIDKVFAVKKRVPVYVEADDAFQFRCSYKLSNMSLEKFAQSENARHLKYSKYDYNKMRYPDTQLDLYELQYCVADVIALHEAVSGIMAMQADRLDTIPYTSTGYVRREARERVQANYANKRKFLQTRLTAEQYGLLQTVKRGGNTHANYMYVNQILSGVKGIDKSSSYPHQMMVKRFPVGKLIEDKCRHVINDACNIMLIRLDDVRLKKGVYIPYMSVSKAVRTPDTPFKQIRQDNGRVISAPRLYVGVTEIDYDIIMRQYDCDCQILRQYVADCDYLNKEYREYVFEMYRLKCELKNDDPYLYAKFKNKINSLFGMMMTDVCRPEIVYENNEWLQQAVDAMEALNAYYHNIKSFLSYQHSVYVTAHARDDLQTAIDLTGSDIVYVDTDSDKYIGQHEDIVDLLNAEVDKINEQAGVKPVVVCNESYVLGAWERDCVYDRFVTQGAKKYAYVYAKDPINGSHAGELGVTVAGLNKKAGAQYLIDHGGLEAFLIDVDGGEIEGAIFDEQHSGRLTPHYNDTVQYKPMTINGHDIELTSNVALLPTTYTLSISGEYADIIRMRTLV